MVKLEELGDEFNVLKDAINKNVDNTSMKDIKNVDESLVKEALGRMKSGKSDVLYEYSSDMLINGPQVLIEHLVNMFQCFLIHGNVPYFLLLCSLVPLVKDPIGDITSSDNYRGIAISSLILKILDWIVLILPTSYSLDTSAWPVQQCVPGLLMQ